MKEKRYTLPEEQKDAAFAAEPAPAYHGNAAIALPEDECAEEDIDWNKIPVGWHPANEEEAVARIEAIEAEYERTGKATDFEEFIEELKAEGLWLIQLKQYQHSMVRRLVVSKKWQTKQSANMILVPSETSKKILAIMLCAQYSKGLA